LTQSHGLYYLYPLPSICASMVSSVMAHAQLGNPKLTKLQKMGSSLKYLSTFELWVISIRKACSSVFSW